MKRHSVQPRAIVAALAMACAAGLFFGSRPLSAAFTSSPISPPPTVPSPIETPTDTPMPTFTFTPSLSPTPSATDCPPSVCTPTPTSTPSRTPTHTRTPTSTPAQPTTSQTPTRTPTRTPLPPPNVRFEMVVSGTTVQVGDVVYVDLIASNAGRGVAGIPLYRLALSASGSPVVLRPAEPPPVSHASIMPGQTDTVRYTFIAMCPGTVALWASVSYEVHFGYPGPATWWSDGTGAQIEVVNPAQRPRMSCPLPPPLPRGESGR